MKRAFFQLVYIVCASDKARNPAMTLCPEYRGATEKNIKWSCLKTVPALPS